MCDIYKYIKKEKRFLYNTKVRLEYTKSEEELIPPKVFLSGKGIPLCNKTLAKDRVLVLIRQY